jgi:hypothetical protein
MTTTTKHTVHQRQQSLKPLNIERTVGKTMSKSI